MTESNFLGYLVLGLITVGSFVTMINKMTQPISELRIIVQELKVCLEHLKESSASNKKRLDDLDEKAIDIYKRVGALEVKVAMYHKEKKTTDE